MQKILRYERPIFSYIFRERSMRFHPSTYTPKNFASHVLALRSDGDPEFGVGRQFVAEVVLGQRCFAVFWRPKDEGDVSGWCVFIRFDGFDMEPRGHVAEIVTSETLKRAVPLIHTAVSESFRPDGVSFLSEVRYPLSPLVISGASDTSDSTRLRDSSMLRESFKEQFTSLLSPDFADVAAMLFMRSVSHGPPWINQRQSGLPLSLKFP